MPRVSVCIPTYNTARYLPQAVESALGQNFDDFEVVVCDNASSDETPRLCAAYLGDPRFRSERYDAFVGQAANWNRCLDQARGDHVILLHADDILRPGFLAAAVRFLDADPDVVLVHCAVQSILPDGSPLSVRRLYHEDRVEPGEVRFRQLLDVGCLINPAGVLVRRTAYQAVGGFTEDVVWGVDWHMWLRLSLQGRVAYLAEPLALYRDHPQSGTSGVLLSGRYATDELRALDDAFRRLPAGAKHLKSLYRPARRKVAQRVWSHAEEVCRVGHGRAARVAVRKLPAIDWRVLFQGKFWGLLAATFGGYGVFEWVRSWKRRLMFQRVAK